MVSELSGNPTFSITGDDKIDFCLAPDEGVDHITVGSITDGGHIEVYLNDEWVQVTVPNFFRDGGAANALKSIGIEITALTNTGAPADDIGGGKFVDADRAQFVNTTAERQNIRIVLLDANYVDRNYTLENQSFNFDPETFVTTFSLAPGASVS